MRRMMLVYSEIVAEIGLRDTGDPTGISAPANLLSYDAAAPQLSERAFTDIQVGLRRWRVASRLAELDIRNRYRGSVLGPFWLTLSTGAMLAGLGILYSALFHETLRSYLPFLSVSLIVWNLISLVVTDATTSLTAAEGIIRQIPLPYSTHALRCVFRNVIIAAHNLPLIVLVLVVSRVLPGPEVGLAVVGLGLLIVNAFFAALLLGMLCARFRDLSQIVASLMQLAFFMKPILWKPASLGPRTVWLAFNPLYAIMQVVRGPVLNSGAPLLIWLSATLYTMVFGLVTLCFFVRFRNRIVFWV